MQGCKVNLKLEEKVLLGREEDRRDLSLVCKRSLLFAGWLGTDWWPSTCPPWPPTPRSRSPRSSSWPPTPWCATATWTTSPGCGNLPRQVRQPVPLFLPDWCLSKELYISIIFPYWLLIFNLCSVNVTQVLSIYQSLLQNYQWPRSVEEKVRTFLAISYIFSVHCFCLETRLHSRMSKLAIARTFISFIIT